MDPREIALAVSAGVLVLVAVAIYIVAASRTKEEDKSEPLTVPHGSVRSILAILIVGGFICFLFFGPEAIDDELFDKVLTAFATLAGSVTGFYFGSRSKASAPESGASSGK